MPPKRSSKKAKTRLTARKRPASRSRCPRPRKKPALRLTDMTEAYSGSEDELDAFPEHVKRVSSTVWRVFSDDRSSPAQEDVMGRTAPFLAGPAARAPQARQPHYYPSPPRTPRPRARAPGSDDWRADASPEDSKDGLHLLEPSIPSWSPQTDAGLFIVDALESADDQDPLEDIDEGTVHLDETRTFLAAFGMHEYATVFHAKGLRTRADYVTFALDCLVTPNIVHDCLAEMFPTVPERKLRPFSWVLCSKVRGELERNARVVQKMLYEAAGEISDGDEQNGDLDEQSGDVDEEDYTSGMDSVDEVQALLEDLVDEMEGEEEEG
ncbi:hypothetical protein EV714DRAFT_286842 [Schizophyllum commune]